MLKKLILFIFLAVSLYATISTKENVTKLYVATFNRAPDNAGLSYWVNDSGLSLENIAKSFFDQPEAKEKYPDVSTNSTFIDSIYSNLFNRTSDTNGFNYWKAELDSGAIEKSVFILAVVNGAQDTDADILSNKTDVGLSFAEAGLSDTTKAKDIMAGITDDTDTITSALDSHSVTLSINAVFKNVSKCLEGQILYENYMDSGSDECFDDPNAKSVDKEIVSTGSESNVDGWFAPSQSICESNNGYFASSKNSCSATLADAENICLESNAYLPSSNEYEELLSDCGVEYNVINSNDSEIQECFAGFNFINPNFYWTSTQSTNAITDSGVVATLSIGNPSGDLFASMKTSVQCKISSSSSTESSSTNIILDDFEDATDSITISTNAIYQVLDYQNIIVLKSGDRTSGNSIVYTGPDGKLYMLFNNSVPYTTSSGTTRYKSEPILKCYSTLGVFQWEYTNFEESTIYGIFFDELGYLYINIFNDQLKISSDSGILIWNKLLGGRRTMLMNEYIYTFDRSALEKFDMEGNSIGRTVASSNHDASSYSKLVHDDNGVFYYVYRDYDWKWYFKSMSFEKGIISEIAIPDLEDDNYLVSQIVFNKGYIYLSKNGTKIFKYSIDGLLVSTIITSSSNAQWLMSDDGDIYIVLTTKWGVKYQEKEISISKYNSNGIQEWQNKYTLPNLSKYSISYSEYDKSLILSGITDEFNPFFVKFKSSTVPETSTEIILTGNGNSSFTGTTSTSTSSDITVTNNSNTGTYRTVEISDTATEFTPSYDREDNIQNAEILAQEIVDGQCRSSGGQPGLANFSTIGCVTSELGGTLYYCEVRATIACTYYNP